MAEKPVAEPVEEKEYFDFDAIPVPFDMGTIEFTPGPEMWQRYKKAVEDPEEFFIPNVIKPGALLYDVLRSRIQTRETIPGEWSQVNAGHEAEYFNPPRPGKKLIANTKVVDKYVRRGKPYVIFETNVKDEDGVPIHRFRRVSLMRSQEVGRKWWAKASKDTQIGAELDPLTRHMTFDKMREFEMVGAMEMVGTVTGQRTGEDHHSNVEMAHAAGHREPIASAHMSICYYHSLLNSFFGPDWVKGGKLSLRFTRPLVHGDTITFRGEVTDKVPENGRTRLVLKVWSENQRGHVTSVGTASGLVD